MEEKLKNNNYQYDPAEEGKTSKKRKVKKLNTILKKNKRLENNGLPKERKTSIKWDETIEPPNLNKKKKLSEEMKKKSSARYNNDIVRDEQDEYLKNLLKVNEIKITDDIIKKIFQKFNEPKEYKKVRTLSTHLNRNYISFPKLENLDSNNDIKVFDGVLDDESKITLKNTIINKFHKDIFGDGYEFHSAQDLKLI